MRYWSSIHPSIHARTTAGPLISQLRPRLWQEQVVVVTLGSAVTATLRAHLWKITPVLCLKAAGKHQAASVCLSV